MQTEIIDCAHLQVVFNELNSRYSNRNKWIFITDSNVHEKALSQLLGYTDSSHEIIELEPGENAKCFDILIHLMDTFISFNIDKKSIIINVGGGVVSDIGGFAAAIYKRGIPYVNIPTSLIGMADAAIGGKTAIDMNHVKNIVGAFHAPEVVLLCPDFLDTLPLHELYSGFAEMIKTAIVGDALLFETLEYLDPSEVNDIKPFVQRCAIIKDKIVRKDPFDQGIRKTLNFGHTIGHAIESAVLASENNITHGHAVALGMKAESWIAHQRGMLNNQDFQRIVSLINKHYAQNVDCSFEDVIPFIYQDKKNEGQSILLALPETIGSCQFNIQISEEEIKAAFLWLIS